MTKSVGILLVIALLAWSAAGGATSKGRSLRQAQGRPFDSAQDRPFDAKRAFRDLVHQCDFGPRVPGTKAHEKCAAWLAAELSKCADSVSRQVFAVEVGGKSLHLTNIIATSPSTPLRAGNPKGQHRVLLCAHWDTRPMADRDPNPKNRGRPIAGANDGASGVAVLLEVARALKARPPKDQVTIVLFDGEDYGSADNDMLLGSRYFAAHYQGSPPDWAALLDMIGDKDLRIPPEAYSELHAPQVVDLLWSAAERAGCRAFVRDRGPAILDDHVPLVQRGIPCIDVIDFDYPHWHTVADTPDKCSAESLGQVGRAVLAVLQ
jgi:glutaminyl-peptide cyclotransferase